MPLGWTSLDDVMADQLDLRPPYIWIIRFVLKLDESLPDGFAVTPFLACRVIVPLICFFLCLTLGVWSRSVSLVLDGVPFVG